MTRTPRKTKKTYKFKALKSADIPVTKAMLYEFRAEVIVRFDRVDSKFTQGDKRFDEVDRRFDEVDRRFDEVDRRFDEVDHRFVEVDRRFDEVDKRFDQVDAKFAQVDARFEQMEARFDQIDAKFAQVDARFDRLEVLILEQSKIFQAGIHQIKLIVEEQNSRNYYVIDKLTNLNDRQDRMEAELKQDIGDIQHVISVIGQKGRV